MAHDEVLQALDAVEAALRRNEDLAASMRERAGLLRERRAAGDSWRDIVEGERPPLVVQLVTTSAEALHDAGARLRRAEARALHEEGLAMDAIARHFGVTRQRISTLLRGR